MMQSQSPNAPGKNLGPSEGLPGLDPRRSTPSLSDRQVSGTSPPKPERLLSIDAYRGFVMLLIVIEVMHFCGVAAALPQSHFWGFLCSQQSHAEWVGCTLHDVIQPGFSFLVGLVLPFSLAARQARGQRF